MKLINTFNNNITLISLILNIIVIIKCIKNILDYIFNKYFIKKIFNYNDELVNVCFYDKKYNYVSFNDIESANNIITLFNKINQKFRLTDASVDGNSEICIGGFLVNRKINTYLVKYFEDFKYITSPDLKEKYGNNPIIEYVPEKNGYRAKDMEFPFNNDIDYAFLIKLTKNDFKDAKKTVHIIHGTNEVGLRRATEYLATKYKEIYKKYKDGHYFFAIEIIRHDNSINYSKGIIDLTAIMFKEDTQ